MSACFRPGIAFPWTALLRRLMLALGLAALALVAPARAQNVPLRFQLVVVPESGDLALLSQADGWAPEDAAVLLLWPRGGAADAGDRGVRDALTEALLEAGASVLELDYTEATDLPTALAEGLRLLRGEFGAGLLIAVGWDRGGEVALAQARADHRLVGRGLPAIAAAVALSPEGLRAAPGAAPAAVEAWPMRASLFCAALPVARDERGACLSGLRRR
jgi:uroporphyrinogen-III synthase